MATSSALGLALCASAQHGGALLWSTPEATALAPLEWPAAAQAVAIAATGAGSGVLHLHKQSLAYATSSHGYIVAIQYDPACPQAAVQLKLAELLNVLDVLVGPAYATVAAAAPTRDALLQRLSSEPGDALDTLVGESAGTYDARSAAPAAGALQALLVSRLHGLAAAAATATTSAPGLPQSPAHDATVTSAFSLLHQHTHDHYPRISTHHVDLTALAGAAAASPSTTTVAAAAASAVPAAVPAPAPEPAVLFSDLVEEGTLEERYGGDMADNIRLALDMVRPPDSQLWTLILGELRSLATGAEQYAASVGRAAPQRQLCSMDLSSLKPGLTISTLMLRLGAQPPPSTGGGDSGGGQGGGAAASGSALGQGSHTAIRRHCHVALVLVYVLEDERLAAELFRGEGAGAAKFVRQSAFRGLPYSVAAGPRAAPAAARAALDVAAAAYEGAFPDSAAPLLAEARRLPPATAQAAAAAGAGLAAMAAAAAADAQALQPPGGGHASVLPVGLGTAHVMGGQGAAAAAAAAAGSPAASSTAAAQAARLGAAAEPPYSPAGRQGSASGSTAAAMRPAPSGGSATSSVDFGYGPEPSAVRQKRPSPLGAFGSTLVPAAAAQTHSLAPTPQEAAAAARAAAAAAPAAAAIGSPPTSPGDGGSGYSLNRTSATGMLPSRASVAGAPPPSPARSSATGLAAARGSVGGAESGVGAAATSAAGPRGDGHSPLLSGAAPPAWMLEAASPAGSSTGSSPDSEHDGGEGAPAGKHSGHDSHDRTQRRSSTSERGGRHAPPTQRSPLPARRVADLGESSSGGSTSSSSSFDPVIVPMGASSQPRAAAASSPARSTATAARTTASAPVPLAATAAPAAPAAAAAPGPTATASASTALPGAARAAPPPRSLLGGPLGGMFSAAGAQAAGGNLYTKMAAEGGPAGPKLLGPAPAAGAAAMAQAAPVPVATSAATAMPGPSTASTHAGAAAAAAIPKAAKAQPQAATVTAAPAAAQPQAPQPQVSAAHASGPSPATSAPAASAPVLMPLHNAAADEEPFSQFSMRSPPQPQPQPLSQAQAQAQAQAALPPRPKPTAGTQQLMRTSVPLLSLTQPLVDLTKRRSAPGLHDLLAVSAVQGLGGPQPQQPVITSRDSGLRASPLGGGSSSGSFGEEPLDALLGLGVGAAARRSSASGAARTSAAAVAGPHVAATASRARAVSSAGMAVAPAAAGKAAMRASGSGVSGASAGGLKAASAGIAPAAHRSAASVGGGARAASGSGMLQVVPPAEPPPAHRSTLRRSSSASSGLSSSSGSYSGSAALSAAGAGVGGRSGAHTSGGGAPPPPFLKLAAGGDEAVSATKTSEPRVSGAGAGSGRGRMGPELQGYDRSVSSSTTPRPSVGAMPAASAGTADEAQAASAPASTAALPGTRSSGGGGGGAAGIDVPVRVGGLAAIPSASDEGRTSGAESDAPEAPLLGPTLTRSSFAGRSSGPSGPGGKRSDASRVSDPGPAPAPPAAASALISGGLSKLSLTGSEPSARLAGTSTAAAVAPSPSPAAFSGAGAATAPGATAATPLAQGSAARQAAAGADTAGAVPDSLLPAPIERRATSSARSLSVPGATPSGSPDGAAATPDGLQPAAAAAAHEVALQTAAPRSGAAAADAAIPPAVASPAVATDVSEMATTPISGQRVATDAAGGVLGTVAAGGGADAGGVAPASSAAVAVAARAPGSVVTAPGPAVADAAAVGVAAAPPVDVSITSDQGVTQPAAEVLAGSSRGADLTGGAMGAVAVTTQPAAGPPASTAGAHAATAVGSALDAPASLLKPATVVRQERVSPPRPLPALSSSAPSSSSPSSTSSSPSSSPSPAPSSHKDSGADRDRKRGSGLASSSRSRSRDRHKRSRRHHDRHHHHHHRRRRNHQETVHHYHHYSPSRHPPPPPPERQAFLPPFWPVRPPPYVPLHPTSSWDHQDRGWRPAGAPADDPTAAAYAAAAAAAAAGGPLPVWPWGWPWPMAPPPPPLSGGGGGGGAAAAAGGTAAAVDGGGVVADMARRAQGDAGLPPATCHPYPLPRHTVATEQEEGSRSGRSKEPSGAHGERGAAPLSVLAQEAELEADAEAVDTAVEATADTAVLADGPVASLPIDARHEGILRAHREALAVIRQAAGGAAGASASPGGRRGGASGAPAGTGGTRGPGQGGGVKVAKQRLLPDGLRAATPLAAFTLPLRDAVNLAASSVTRARSNIRQKAGDGETNVEDEDRTTEAAAAAVAERAVAGAAAATAGATAAHCGRQQAVQGDADLASIAVTAAAAAAAATAAVMAAGPVQHTLVALNAARDSAAAAAVAPTAAGGAAGDSSGAGAWRIPVAEPPLKAGSFASPRAAIVSAPWSLPPGGSPARPPSLFIPVGGGPPFTGSPHGSPAASAYSPRQASPHILPSPAQTPYQAPPPSSPRHAAPMSYTVPGAWPAPHPHSHPHPQPALPHSTRAHHPMHHAYPQPAQQQLHYTAQGHAFHPHPGRPHQLLHHHRHSRSSTGGPTAAGAGFGSGPSGGRQLLLSPRQQHQLYVELLQLQQLQEQQQRHLQREQQQVAARGVPQATAVSSPGSARGAQEPPSVSAETLHAAASSHRPMYSPEVRVSQGGRQQRHAHSRPQGSVSGMTRGSASLQETAAQAGRSAAESTDASPLQVPDGHVGPTSLAGRWRDAGGQGSPQAVAAPPPRTPQRSTPGSGSKHRHAPPSSHRRQPQHQATPTRLGQPRAPQVAHHRSADHSSSTARSAAGSGSGSGSGSAAGGLRPAAATQLPTSAAAPYGAVVPWLRLMTNTAVHVRAERTGALELEAEVVAALVASAEAAAAAAAEGRSRHVHEQVAAALAAATAAEASEAAARARLQQPDARGAGGPPQPARRAGKHAVIREAAAAAAAAGVGKEDEHLVAPMPHVAVLRETRRQHHARHAALAAVQQPQAAEVVLEAAGLGSAGGVQLPSKQQQQQHPQPAAAMPSKEHSLLAEWVQHGSENAEGRRPAAYRLQGQQQRQQGPAALVADAMNVQSSGSCGSRSSPSSSLSVPVVRGAAAPAASMKEEAASAAAAAATAASQAGAEGVQEPASRVAGAPTRSSAAASNAVATAGSKDGSEQAVPGLAAYADGQGQGTGQGRRHKEGAPAGEEQAPGGRPGGATRSLALLASVAEKLGALAGAQ